MRFFRLATLTPTVALLALGAGCKGDDTSLVLNLVATTGPERAPSELRVFVYQGDQPVYDDERMPKAGALETGRFPSLGSVVLYLGGASGALEINVFGVRAGQRDSRGRARVVAQSGKQVTTFVELAPIESWPDGVGSLGLGGLGAACRHGDQCLTGFCVDGACCSVSSCGVCQTCAGVNAGHCALVARGAEDTADGCTVTRACDGQGACRSHDGEACSGDDNCLGGHCVDGVCCDTACTGPCRSCTVLGAEGTCQGHPAGSDPEKDCGAGLTCDGSGACGPSCRGDGDCGNTAYCHDGSCLLRGAAGARCGADKGDPSGNHQCVSGSCVDGRCCTQVCGTCQACTGPGGTCAPIPVAGEDLSSNGGCRAPSACDGKGGCRRKNGESCNDGAGCASGTCVSGICCDNSCTGACRQCGSGTCLPLVNVVDPRTCDGSRMCNSRGDCTKRAGESCATGGECASGFCVDGHCCNTACNASCFTCTSGTCTVRTNGRDAECGGGRSCDGAGNCR